MFLFIFFYFLLIFPLLSTSIEKCHCSSFSTSFLFFPSSPPPLKSVLVHLSLLSSHSFSSSPYPSKSVIVHLFPIVFSFLYRSSFPRSMVYATRIATCWKIASRSLHITYTCTYPFITKFQRECFLNFFIQEKVHFG